MQDQDVCSWVEHKLELQGNLGCFRVSLCETISVPPRSEMVCSGQVLDLPKLPQIPLLIEPCAKFQDSGRDLVARSLVNSSEFPDS
jgi:hypothetical protein